MSTEEKEKKLEAKPYEWCAPAAYRVMQAHKQLADASLELRQLMDIHGLGRSPEARQLSIAMTNGETAFLFAREVHESLAEKAVPA